MVDRIWLTWEIQRRNRTLSSKLDAELHEITSTGPRWKRYPRLIFRTLKILFQTRPSLIFSQNPSLLLTAIVVGYGKISKATIIVDAHNAGIFPIEGKSALLNKIARIVNSHSDKVIVSNTALKKFINKNERDVYAIPDPIPVITTRSGYPVMQDKFNLVFICSWAEDEPYEEVLLMAGNLRDSVNIYITGNSCNKEKTAVNTLPSNVTLTGFLSDNDYEELLVACDAVMVLTKRDDCLVCGAYEGVSVEKPMILSNTNALVEYFDKGCTYTDNSCRDIEGSIRKLVGDYDNLIFEIKHLKMEREQKMDVLLNKFNQMLS